MKPRKACGSRGSPRPVESLSFAHRGSLLFGRQTVAPGEHYEWNGLQRGGDPRRPQWLFQYTLAGQGLFRTGKTWQPVPKGNAFCAKIPSRHAYRNDTDAGDWTFFWLIVGHQEVSRRILEQRSLCNTVLALPENSAVIEGAETLLDSLPLPLLDSEENLFRWMFELERFATAARHPGKEAQQLRRFVQTLVENDLGRLVTIDELARAWGATRSNFSHHFKKTTGQPPAAWVRDVRLRHAARLLGTGRFSIKEAAALTGFGGSNPFCKAFRQHFQMSPGVYRRLKAPSPPNR